MWRNVLIFISKTNHNKIYSSFIEKCLEIVSKHAHIVI